MVAELGSTGPTADEAKMLAHQIAVCKDAIKGYEIQLSNADGRVEAVKKPGSELDETWAKRTERRQKQHSEFVTLTENNAAEMESLKLAQSCDNQSSEREEAAMSRGEELLVTHEKIDRLNDDDALELFKTHCNSASNLKLISLVLSDRSADFLKAISLIDEMVTLPKGEQGKEDETFIDKLVNVPVVLQRQVPMIQKPSSHHSNCAENAGSAASSIP